MARTQRSASPSQQGGAGSKSAYQNLLRAALAASAVLTADKAAPLLATTIAAPRYGFDRHSKRGRFFIDAACAVRELP